MIGAIIGDVVGSRFEFHNIKSKQFQFWHNDCHPTDDTFLTCAVADWLLNGGAIENFLGTWGTKYKDITFEAGKISAFSSGFTNWLSTPQPYNADTNGCIMRISPILDFFDDYDQMLSVAKQSTNITHNHPDSINATYAYITTGYMLKTKQNIQEIKNTVSKKCDYDLFRTIDEIRPTYNKFFCKCKNSVPQAIICALDSKSFTDAIRNAISIGGDSDTLAAMAGGLAEIRFGVPQTYKDKVQNYLDSNIKETIAKFYAKISTR